MLVSVLILLTNWNLKMSEDHKYYRAQEERNGIIKILENLSYNEKKEVLRIVDQSMINSANNVLANDDPPGKLLTRLPNKFRKTPIKCNTKLKLLLIEIKK